MYTMVIDDVHDFYGNDDDDYVQVVVEIEPGMRNSTNRPKMNSEVHKLKIKKLQNQAVCLHLNKLKLAGQ